MSDIRNEFYNPTFNKPSNLYVNVSVLADDMEYRLTKFLMSNYDASVRPVENSSVPLKVIFGISLHHIIDVVSL